MYFPFRSTFAGVNTSPLPVPIIGPSSIKKAQSLPKREAYSFKISLDSFRPNKSFSKRNVHAASDEPPPKPAPVGMILCKWIFAGGNE